MSLSVTEQRKKWREASKRYRNKHQDRIKKKNEKYGKENFAKASRKYAHNNKDKIREKAKMVYNKDKTKALVRANTNHNNEKTRFCIDCGEKKKTEFHHLSYKPNIFIEVCRKCHNVRHGRGLYVTE